LVIPNQEVGPLLAVLSKMVQVIQLPIYSLQQEVKQQEVMHQPKECVLRQKENY